MVSQHIHTSRTRNGRGLRRSSSLKDLSERYGRVKNVVGCVQAMLRPSEWGDDAAMALMFAPFEPREKAQAVYDRKMAFWTAAIRRRCQSKRSATFSVQRLAGEFERYGQTPSCLSTVVDCMIRCPQFVPADADLL